MTKLHISPTLSLPLDFVTSTQVILAQKGKGKSYTASVEAEELLEAKQQIVVVDPTGAWYGLRSSPDGRSSGYSIAVFGGEHGDVPLESTAGEVVADAIATEHFSAIIDLTLFRKGEALRFMAVFLETLYRKNRTPLHLFVDEADVVAPQKTFGPEQTRVLGAAEDIVRRGRIRGIGCTLITQRPQVLNKDVLTQADMLTTLGMSHPKDLGAIEAWVAVHGDPAKAKTMIASLPSLPRGEAWVWNPSIDLFKRVSIRARRTFDSGRTPKSGERKVDAKVLAPVDIQRLGVDIAATVERQKANDPKALKLRVAELEKQLATKVSAAKPGKVVEKLAIKDAQLKRIEDVLTRGERMAGSMKTSSIAYAAMADKHRELGASIEVELVQLRSALGLARQPADVLTPMTRSQIAEALYAGAKESRIARNPAAMVRRDPKPANGGDPGDPDLTGPERRILEALAWMDGIGQAEPPIEAVAFLADYRPGGGAFNNTRGALRAKGYVDYPSAGALRLTELGRAAAPTPSIPGSGDQLRATVIDRLAGPERKLLEPLIDAYPGALTTEELAERSGYGAGGGAFNNTRGRLRTLGLADYPRPGHVRAADLLFPEGA